MTSHFGACALRIVIANRLVDPPMHFGRLFEIVCAFDGPAALLVDQRGNHFDEREKDWISGRAGNRTMKSNVVDEIGLRLTQIREHPRHFLCHRREGVGESPFRSKTGGADFENLARFENLLAREAVQSREKTERSGAEARRAGGDEGAGALTRLGHAHGGEGVKPCTNSRPANAQLERELALGGEPVAGPQLTALDQRRNVPHDVVGGVNAAILDFQLFAQLA